MRKMFTSEFRRAVLTVCVSIFLGATIAIATPTLHTNGKIAFTSDRDGNQEIYIMNADGTNQIRLTYNSLGDDFPTWSPDGKTDIAVYRPSSGVWLLDRSSLGMTGVQLGLSTDKVVPADDDGDGKTDIAVNRDGTWYLLQSSLGFAAITFGFPTDIPVPADYDGDGKGDISVWRPSTGVWYSQKSTSGFSATQFGLAEDKPIPAGWCRRSSFTAARFTKKTDCSQTP